MYKPIANQRSEITLEKMGSQQYRKISFPVHCGIYSEIESESHVFHFNLNHEIIRAKGKDRNWHHPHEWLKRSMGNDWVYYSTGGYAGVFEATGEYYLPNFNYSSNSVLGGRTFKSPEIQDLTTYWPQILNDLKNNSNLPDHESSFLEKVLANSPELLRAKAEKFHNIIDGRVSVLPPDARHVGYNLIPFLISRGCLYKCRFCKVKNNIRFRELEREEIDGQIAAMKELYSRDTINYNAIFLGEHDALLASPKTILYSIEKAEQEFGLSTSYVEGSNYFLFASASSLLGAPEELFKDLNGAPGMTYINVGLESPDQETLDKIGKPLSSATVWEAFRRIQDINKSYSSIEVTVNFIMDGDLPSGHYPEIEKLIRDTQVFQQAKGCVYFSPLTFDKPSRARLFEFNRLKLMSRFPTFLYIIQRL